MNLFDAAPNAILAKSSTKLLTPVESGPRWWIQADGGIYGFSKNSPIIAATAPPGSTGPIHLATAPGFVGLFTTSTVINPLAVGVPATFGAGGSYRMGYWLDPARTMAIDGSAFFVQGYSKFDLTSVPTTVRTSTSINTTPDVFVGLFTDTTTTALNGAISDQFFGADVNFRMKVAHFADLTNFDVLVGMRYAALNEKLAASVDSELSRTYQPGLGLPPPVNFNNSSVGGGVFETRNNFIGPQIGFNAEQHWGRFWVGTENKLAVGAMIEGVSVSGSTENTITPTRTLVLAGIPLQVNGGAPVTGIVGGPPSFGLFTQGNRSKTAFALVPNGTITVGYDIIPDMLSLVLAYNYIYLSSVGRVGDQITSPNDIKQSSFFAQGITVGAKAKF